MNNSDNLEVLFNGGTKPEICKAIFAINDYGEKILLRCEPSLEWFIEEFGTNLNDIVDSSDYKKIPDEIGLYSCVLSLHTYKSNHPLDPVEWNTDVLISNIQLINKLEL